MQKKIGHREAGTKATKIVISKHPEILYVMSLVNARAIFIDFSL